MVGNGNSAFLQFDMGTLPIGTIGTKVAKATLTVWVNKTDVAGALDVRAVTNAWTEAGLATGTPPGVGSSVVATTPVSDTGRYVSFDISELVKTWIDYPSQNFGVNIAASAADPVAVVAIDSKENTLTGHTARLDISLEPVGPVGATGATGPAGPAGAQGIAGAPGAKGDKGDTGVAGVKGDKGDKGDTGVAGIQGVAGAAGAKGDKGDTGLAGAQGAAGAKGDKGDAGAAGVQGGAGAKGDKGDTGVAGAQGVAGAKGDAGVAGTPGAQGGAGPKGDTGAAGAQGIAGAKGDTGAPGATGATGPTGPAGQQGVAGATGATGPQGLKGNTGATGATGPQGSTGATGPAGIAGVGILVDTVATCSSNVCLVQCDMDHMTLVSGTCSFEAINGPQNNFPLTQTGLIRHDGIDGDIFGCTYAAPGPTSVGKKVIAAAMCVSKSVLRTIK